MGAATMEDLWNLLTEHDDDNDGFISRYEFERLLLDAKTSKVLRQIDVDLEGLINVSDFILEEHAGKLNKPDFKRMVLDLRSKNAATVKDHVETRKFVHAHLKQAGLLESPRDTSP